MSEAKTEYRVTVDQVGGPVELAPQPLADCKARVEAIRTGSEVFGARIQSRTITETPWEDIADAA